MKKSDLYRAVWNHNNGIMGVNIEAFSPQHAMYKAIRYFNEIRADYHGIPNQSNIRIEKL